MTNEYRCHRPTLRGWSCMHLVAAEGDPCAQHTPGRQTPLQQAEARALAAEVASRGYRERAEKAEAERDAAQRVMSAHRCYRHRCTCTMTEQDPWCPTHPIVDHIGPGGAAVREGGE